MVLVVTGFYGSLTALLILALTFNVVKMRRRFKIGVGDGGNMQLKIANRAHGNLLENTAIVLLLLATAEANGLGHFWLHSLGLIWIVARVLHAIGLIQGEGGYHFGRASGTLATWLVILVLALVNIGLFLTS